MLPIFGVIGIADVGPIVIAADPVAANPKSASWN